MGASFPNSIASFSIKRNLLDDVDANDINRLQEEIVAIETVLGPLIAEIHDLEDDGSALNQKFKTLKELIDYIRNGYHIHAVELKTRDQKVKKTPLPEGHQPDVVPMDAPNLFSDPYGLYDGKGFTIKRTGFYIIQGHLRYETKLGASSDNYGLMEAAIMVDDVWSKGLDRNVSVADNAIGVKDRVWQWVFHNPVRMGWFTAGSKVRLGALQSSNITQVIGFASLGAVCLRRPDPSAV